MSILLLLLSLATAAAFGGGLATAGSPAAATEARAAAAAATTRAAPATGIDPRSGGFEIIMGEWALSAEAKAIRPGRVTFVIRNRGKFRHGFEIELDRDGHRGRGGDRDDDWESIELRPGQTTTLTLNLAPGVYKIECFVSDHDDMGMEGFLEVREDAPLVYPRPATSRSAVEIAGFVYKPATLKTTVGTVVTWKNSDAAPHTATGKQFSSPQLRKGGTFRHRFTRAGTYAYVCALHPGMKGKVVVAPRSAR